MTEATKTSEVKIQVGELYLDELNLILGALGQLPFSQVSGLVTKLRDIAIPQLPKDQETAATPAEATAA